MSGHGSTTPDAGRPPPVPPWLISATEAGGNDITPQANAAGRADVSQVKLLPAVIQWKAAFRIAIWAGFGAAIGIALYLAILGMPHWSVSQWTGFVLAMAIGGVWRNKVDPALHDRLFRRTSPVRPSTDIVKRTLLGVIFGAGLEIVVELVHGQSRESGPGFVGLLFASILTTALITYFWILGARRQVPRAACYGTLGGLIVAVPLQFILSAAPGSNAVFLLANTFFWLAIGLTGGLVIDKDWCRDGIWKVPICATGAGLIVEGIYMRLVGDSSFITAFLHDIMRGVGWGIGLWLCPIAPMALSSLRSKDL
jgi:hypothetical protein